MIGVFFNQHHRQQARAGKAARDGVEWRGRLRDRLARPATELLPHMLGHEPLPGDDVERLGDVLADLGELVPAAARTRRRRRVNNPPARQIGREVAPRPLASREALHVDARRLGLGRILAGGRSQFLELQFQLINKPLAARSERGPNSARFIFAIVNCKCAIRASAPDSLARISISAAFSAAASSGR